MDHPELVTIFGGSGFVGTQVAQLLARAGYRIRVAVRRPDLAGPVRMFGSVGQVVPIQANVRNKDSVAAAVRGAAIVINLAAIGIEKGKQRFRAVNVTGARNVAAAAKAAGVTTLVHMSALGADANSPSLFARSRAMGEAEVRAHFPDAIIFRPSVIFGVGDDFFNTLGHIARMLPVMPLFGGKTRFQPVYVGDVAEAIARSVDGKLMPGGVYELGGPDVQPFRNWMQDMLAVVGRKRLIVSVPWWLASLQGAILGLLPSPLLTTDQVRLLKSDNVVSADAVREGRTLQGMGITPEAVDAILPAYLWRYRVAGQYSKPRPV